MRRTLASNLKTSLDSGRFVIPEVLISGAYTITGADNGIRLVVTAAVTLTVPAVGVLGNGFECEIINDSNGTVTIDGPGSTNVDLADEDVACIIEGNGKQRVVVGASTVVS